MEFLINIFNIWNLWHGTSLKTIITIISNISNKVTRLLNLSSIPIKKIYFDQDYITFISIFICSTNIIKNY